MFIGGWIVLLVLTPGAWLFGTPLEKVVYTLLPLTMLGVSVSAFTSKVEVDPTGVRVVALPLVQKYRWQDIEEIDTVKSGLARMPVAVLRVKGRTRPVKLWQTGRLSIEGMRERDAFIAEMRRQHGIHHVTG